MITKRDLIAAMAKLPDDAPIIGTVVQSVGTVRSRTCTFDIKAKECDLITGQEALEITLDITDDFI